MNTKPDPNKGKFLTPIIVMVLNLVAVLWTHDHQFIWTWFALVYGITSTAGCALWSYVLLKRYNIGLGKKG